MKIYPNKTGLAAIAAITMAGLVHGAPAQKPNIIFFINDDQVKEEVGCYGGKVLTPHLDRLAREGMRMDNAHVVSTVCTPSRYSMFTGRYPGNSWFKSYLAEYPRDRHGAPGFNMGLEEDNMNVGNVLRQSVYVTGHVGKLHVGVHLKDPTEYAHHGLYDVSKKSGLHEPDAPEVIAGWQRNEKWYRQWIMDRGFSWARHVYWGNVHGAYPHHNPEWTLEAALEFIEENRDKPFYLHYATTMMHGGPNGWNNSLGHPLASGAGKLEKRPHVIPPRDELCKRVDAAGLDESAYGFTWMDATVGAMLDKLDQLGIADNTLFVFVADHGTEGKFSLHDHPYFELGYARGIRTDKWKYIAIRYGAERFGQIENASLQKLPQFLAYQGGAKNASNHLQRRAHYLEPDQLYNLADDPLEMNNLVRNPEFKTQLEKMRELLTAKLEAQGRPFGEFVPGADSVPAEKILPYLERMKQLRPVKKGFVEIGDTPAKAKPMSKAERKASREARKIRRGEP